MASSEFRFKKFSVEHLRSSMKVGVDAVLIGSWASHKKPQKILDVGTGCGVIAMMMSQRYPEAIVHAIDIDQASIEEASENFSRFFNREKIEAKLRKFPDELMKDSFQYDLIVSNPPYFNSGIQQPSTPRERARHQDGLSVFSLLEHSLNLLSPKGVLAVIFPIEDQDYAIATAKRNGLVALRECRIRNRNSSKEKRVMMEFIKSEEGVEFKKENLILFEGENPTLNYKTLCKDFYLKF